MRTLLTIFILAFSIGILNAEEKRCYFVADVSKFPDKALEQVWDNLILKGKQTRVNKVKQPRDIISYMSNQDDSKRLIQGTFTDEEIEAFNKLKWIKFIGYNVGVNMAEDRVNEYLAEHFNVEISSGIEIVDNENDMGFASKGLIGILSLLFAGILYLIGRKKNAD